MSLSPEQVRQVAQLARLDMKSEQVEHYARQLSNILAMVDQLAKVDTTDTPPMAHPLDMIQRLRADAITDPVGEAGREVFQALAPQTANGLFLVPKVIE